METKDHSLWSQSSLKVIEKAIIIEIITDWQYCFGPRHFIGDVLSYVCTKFGLTQSKSTENH